MAKKYTVAWWSGLRPEVAGKETERLVEEEQVQAALDEVFSSDVANVT